MAADPPLRSAAILVAMLAATTSLSQFFRASTTVIAPELIRDLTLSPEMLGFAGACFFLALGAVQVPVGILFDRFGARLTVAVLALIAVGGALMHAFVEDGRGLALARFILGVGHGGSFMATVFLISRWYPRARWSTALSWVFAASMLGIVAAGTPLAFASERLGWRTAFLLAAGVQAMVGILFLLLVRDDPPGSRRPPQSPETFLAALGGFVTIVRLPGLMRVMALQFFAYAVLATMMGLWAGPYLHDVHGLDPVARGNVLIAMAVAQTVGVLATGPLDRVFNTRKWVAAGGALLTIATLLALAATPRPATPLAIGLLVVLCAVSAYGVVVVSHGRTFYPEHLAGRGATTFNFAQVMGCALVPIATGYIPGFFPITASGYAPEAYQWIFAGIAAALGSGLIVYLTSTDAKPLAAPANANSMGR
ncbi:MAG: MFS transporter [Hyphomicrobiaceae bacterium]